LLTSPRTARLSRSLMSAPPHFVHQRLPTQLVASAGVMQEIDGDTWPRCTQESAPRAWPSATDCFCCTSRAVRRADPFLPPSPPPQHRPGPPTCDKLPGPLDACDCANEATGVQVELLVLKDSRARKKEAKDARKAPRKFEAVRSRNVWTEGSRCMCQAE